MSGWTAAELGDLAAAYQMRVAGRRADGSWRTLVIVWQVVVEGVLYVRSVKGPEGEWYKGVARHFEGFVDWNGRARPVTYTRDGSRDAEVDAAYFAKYGNGSPSRAITSAAAKQTTLRVDPVGSR
ncbi:DUF2255 family protein [Microbacterium sp. B2969]|uniref:DUF2255 family protein n=1 Tax=Microbacterium alkaliflavum TaxID=3248839 RepID=A0ABW7Q9C2_9MICO